MKLACYFTKFLILLLFKLYLCEVCAVQAGDNFGEQREEQRLAITRNSAYARGFHFLSDVSTVSSIVTGTWGAIEAYNGHIHLEGQLITASTVLIGCAGLLRFSADYFDIGNPGKLFNKYILCRDNLDSCRSSFCQASTYALYAGSLICNIYSIFSDNSELVVDLLGVGFASLAGFTNKDTYLYRSLFAIDRLNYMQSITRGGGSPLPPRRAIIKNSIELLKTRNQQGRTEEIERNSAAELQDFYEYLNWAGHIRNMYEHIDRSSIRGRDNIRAYIISYLKETFDKNKTISKHFPFLVEEDNEAKREARRRLGDFLENCMSYADNTYTDASNRTIEAVRDIPGANNFENILNRYVEYRRNYLVPHLLRIIEEEINTRGEPTMNPIRHDPALPLTV